MRYPESGSVAGRMLDVAGGPGRAIGCGPGAPRAAPGDRSGRRVVGPDHGAPRRPRPALPDAKRRRGGGRAPRAPAGAPA